MMVVSEAYKNLPDKFQRQHQTFEFGGVDSSNPVAHVQYPTLADLLADKGHITEDEQRTIDAFARVRLIAMAGMDYATLQLDNDHGAIARIEDADEANVTARDQYHRILQSVSPVGLNTLLLAIAPPPPRDIPYTQLTLFITWLQRACADAAEALKE